MYSQLFKPELEKKNKNIKRRTDDELDKNHCCPYPDCRKSYASPLSLSFHMRGKHNAGTKTERLAYIVGYCLFRNRLPKHERQAKSSLEPISAFRMS